MWARNLSFLALCLGGLLAFMASVFPPETPAARPQSAFDAKSIESVVKRVDAAFEKDWLAHGLQPAGRAEDLAIARRLSLALTGTIPSLEEIRQFEARPERERLDGWLSCILADRRYDDFVAERLARAYVGVDDGPFFLFRRRRFVSWLADELKANRPYNTLVQELITGAGLWTDHPEANFITVAIKPDSDEDPDAGKLAARVSRAFLGIRLDCAECHDHPFEDWKQRDFQGLAAYFGQTQKSFRGIVDGHGDYQVENRKTGEMETIPPGVPFQSELARVPGSRRQQLAAWITHRENRAFAREAVNRAWAVLFGKALVEPIDNISGSGALPEALDLLADDFTEHGYDWQRLLRAITATRVFQLDSKADPAQPDQEITAEHEAHWAAFPIIRLRPEQVVGGVLQSASLETINYESNILVRLFRTLRQAEFVNRYGDSAGEEFDPRGGTIPQRLLMMNGDVVESQSDGGLGGASTRIATLAADDAQAVEIATLAVLSRRPTDEESRYFAARLANTSGLERHTRLEDLYWTLLNTTEFSWNH